MIFALILIFSLFVLVMLHRSLDSKPSFLIISDRFILKNRKISHNISTWIKYIYTIRISVCLIKNAAFKFAFRCNKIRVLQQLFYCFFGSPAAAASADAVRILRCKLCIYRTKGTSGGIIGIDLCHSVSVDLKDSSFFCLFIQ